MKAIDTMRTAGRDARHKAGAMGHSLKDQALEKRLDRATHEAERLRFENDRLRDEVVDVRSEHSRILDLLESRMEAAAEDAPGEPEKKHRGRRLLFVAALGAGVFAWFQRRSADRAKDDWAPEGDGVTDSTRSSVSTI